MTFCLVRGYPIYTAHCKIWDIIISSRSNQVCIALFLRVLSQSLALSIAGQARNFTLCTLRSSDYTGNLRLAAYQNHATNGVANHSHADADFFIFHGYSWLLAKAKFDMTTKIVNSPFFNYFKWFQELLNFYRRWDQSHGSWLHYNTDNYDK